MKNVLVKPHRWSSTAKWLVGLTLFYFIAKTLGHR
jgi:hypothetical protein